MDRNSHIVFPISGTTIAVIVAVVIVIAIKAYNTLQGLAEVFGIILPIIAGVISIALIIQSIAERCWGNVFGGLFADVFFLIETYCFASQLSNGQGEEGLWGGLMWLLGFAVVGINYLFGIIGWLALNGAREDEFYIGSFIKGFLLLGISCGVYYWFLTTTSVTAGSFLAILAAYMLMGFITSVST